MAQYARLSPNTSYFPLMPTAYVSRKVECSVFTQQAFTQGTQYMENAFQPWSWDHFATWFMVPEGDAVTECRVGRERERK